MGSKDNFKKESKNYNLLNKKNLNRFLIILLPLIIGFIFYYLEEANYITPGSYFGSSAWPNYIIGISGLTLWFYSIPNLLKMSYENWTDKKYLWILYLLLIPIFYLIGLFFQIGLGYFILLTVYIGSFILLFKVALSLIY